LPVFQHLFSINNFINAKNIFFAFLLVTLFLGKNINQSEKSSGKAPKEK